MVAVIGISGRLHIANLHLSAYFSHQLRILCLFIMADNNELIAAILQGVRGVRVKDRKYASRGGNAYPEEEREMVIEMMVGGTKLRLSERQL